MGKKLTLNNTDSTFVAEAKDSIVDKALAGVTGMFSDAETVAYTSDILLWGQLTTNAINAVATSMYTRKRAEGGEDAIFGVLF